MNGIGGRRSACAPRIFGRFCGDVVRLGLGEEAQARPVRICQTHTPADTASARLASTHLRRAKMGGHRRLLRRIRGFLEFNCWLGYRYTRRGGSDPGPVRQRRPYRLSNLPIGPPSHDNKGPIACVQAAGAGGFVDVEYRLELARKLGANLAINLARRTRRRRSRRHRPRCRRAGNGGPSTSGRA